MWMKETYKGLMSGIIYARKGDKVTLVQKDIDMSFVEKENGEKFHVRSERLSDIYVPPDPPDAIEETDPSNKKYHKQQKKAVTLIQNDLFS